MPSKQSPEEKKTVERVMHEYKHGELRIRGSGPKVKSSKQAIAIALHEAGATGQESPKKNRQNLARTKAKERRGATAKDAAEGNRRGKSAKSGGEPTRAELYEMAKKRDIPGRSKMSKSELARALHH